MKIVLDTNIIYEWMKSNDGKAEKFDHFFLNHKYSEISISNFGFYELLYKNDQTVICDFLNAKSIVIASKESQSIGYSEFKIAMGYILKAPSLREKYIKDFIKSTQQYIEGIFSIFLTMYILFIPFSVGLMIEDTLAETKDSINNVNKLSILLVNYVRTEAKSLAENYFKKDNIDRQKYLKDSMTNLRDAAISIILNFQNKSITDEHQASIEDTFFNPRNAKKIIKQINNYADYIANAFMRPNINNNHFESKKYLLQIIKDHYLNSRQFEMNDIADAMLLELHPDYRIITLEKRLSNYLKIFDHISYELSKNLREFTME